jgi:MFS family permease
VLAVADDLAVYLGAAVVWTVGSMLAAPPNAQINADLAPPDLRARYQSVFYLTFPAAALVAPMLGGVSLQYLGDRHWLIVGGLGLLAAVGHLLAGPPRERHVDALRRAADREPAETHSDKLTVRRQSAHHVPKVMVGARRWGRRRRATLTPVSIARSRRRSKQVGTVPQRLIHPSHRASPGARI